VYCGQTVGWIKIKLGMETGLGPGKIVLDGDPVLPTPKRAHPKFMTHVGCNQTPEWFNMSLGMEVCPGDIV